MGIIRNNKILQKTGTVSYANEMKWIDTQITGIQTKDGKDQTILLENVRTFILPRLMSGSSRDVGFFTAGGGTGVVEYMREQDGVFTHAGVSCIRYAGNRGIVSFTFNGIDAFFNKPARLHFLIENGDYIDFGLFNEETFMGVDLQDYDVPVSELCFDFNTKTFYVNGDTVGTIDEFVTHQINMRFGNTLNILDAWMDSKISMPPDVELKNITEGTILVKAINPFTENNNFTSTDVFLTADKDAETNSLSLELHRTENDYAIELHILNGHIYYPEVIGNSKVYVQIDMSDYDSIYLEMNTNEQVQVYYSPLLLDLPDDILIAGNIRPQQIKGEYPMTIRGKTYYRDSSPIDVTVDQIISMDFHITGNFSMMGALMGDYILDETLSVQMFDPDITGYHPIIPDDWIETVDVTDGNTHTIKFIIYNGVISCTLDDLPVEDDEYQEYVPSANETLYVGAWYPEDTVIIENISYDPYIQVVPEDPLADADFFNINNWGTFPSASSSSAQTGTPTPATTSDLTINTTAKTISDNNLSYMVYNKTLQDFLDYYGDTFSLIAYKTGGDGRYDIGFCNTTTGGYKFGYVQNSGSYLVKNEEKNISNALGTTEYQKYNEITFKKDSAGNITIYYKKEGTTYVSYMLGSVTDMSQYYLYFKSYNRTSLSITNDRTKIENDSGAPTQ